MIIKNNTSNTIIAENAIEALSLKQKIFGLIISKKPVPMIFKTKFGIHTFFMRYPIDVIVLNNKNVVVSIKKSLKPYRIFLWNPVHSLIIELPEGSIGKSNIHLGDFLRIM